MSTHQMKVLDRTGHTTLTWSPGDVDSKIAELEKQFDGKLAEGYLGYKADENGGNEEQIKSFDKTAPQIILTPPLAGG